MQIARLVLLSLTTAVACYAQTIQNASFEEPAFTGPPYSHYVPTEYSLPGWTFSGSGLGEASYLIDSSAGSPYLADNPTTDGTHSFRLSFGDKISQTVTDLIPGVTYLLTFASTGAADSQRPLRVTFGGASNDFTTGGFGLSMSWLATGTSALLSFEAISAIEDAGVSGAVLDNVSIGAVPEPAVSSLLCGLTVAMMVMQNRRNAAKRRRVA